MSMKILIPIALFFLKRAFPDLYSKARILVSEAEAISRMSGAERREWVAKEIGDEAEAWLINLIIEAAYAEMVLKQPAYG